MTNKMENEMDEKNSFDRIKALEGEVAELHESDLAQRSKLITQNVQIAELQASNHDLREALKTIAIESHEELWQREFAFKALSATPAESLQSHYDELIEKCAKVCEGKLGGAHKEHEWWYGFKAGMKQASDAIRALKEVK